jgi:methionine synthase II (cobalamin-independent)
VSPRSEQGKLPAAKEFKLAERDKHMSEEKLTYMQQLDVWIHQNVFGPLLTTSEEGESEEVSEEQLDQVAKAIREKIRESYKNGCKAGAGHVRIEYRRADQAGRGEKSYAQAQAR